MEQNGRRRAIMLVNVKAEFDDRIKLMSGKCERKVDLFE